MVVVWAGPDEVDGIDEVSFRLSDEMKVFGRALEVVRSSGDVIADVRMLLFVVYAAVRA